MKLLKTMIILMIVLFSTILSSTNVIAQKSNLPNGFGTVVYDNGGTYIAQSYNTILISSVIPDTVIKTALERGGDIYIASGTYYLSNNFHGYDLKSNTHLKLAQDANIVVPSGYTGYVFRFNTLTIQCVLEGGKIYEAMPVKRNWTGILLQGDAISFNYIKNMVITNPFIAIDFKANSPDYISANTFDNINANNFVRGIEFDFTGKYIHGSTGFFGNTFQNLQFQSGNMTTYGAKDIEHLFNTFYNVYFWDLPLDAQTTIDPLAEKTLIIGGMMTYRNFVDNSHSSIILDAWHPKVLTNSTISSIILSDVYPADTNMSILSSHHDSNMTISSQLEHDSQLSPWIKDGTKLWSQGDIDDNAFGNIVLNLINSGIIQPHTGNMTSSSQSVYFPKWFKNNAEWWVDGQISENDFILGIQYLLNNGIVKI